jgi:hypothetical protein
MAHKKRYLPRYQSAMAGASLLIAERRMRKKTGATLASPLGHMGRQLLTHRVKARSPTGIAIRFGSHLARQRIRKRLFPQKATPTQKNATGSTQKSSKESPKEAKNQKK